MPYSAFLRQDSVSANFMQ